MSGAIRPSLAVFARRPIVSQVARTRRLTELLPDLHRFALETTGGVCSLLFEVNAQRGTWQATSGYRLDVLRSEPWRPSGAEARILDDVFARGAPTLVSDPDRQTPDLAARLNTPSILLLPIASDDERVGLVVVGFEEPPTAMSIPRDAQEVGDAFLAALELFRLRQDAELQRDLGELLTEFAANLSGTLSLAAGLEVFCRGANRLFGADRTSVWIHDRRARCLVIQGSSDSGKVLRGERVGTDDPLAPAALGMRRRRSEIESPCGETATSTIVVPLRGCRRALGTIVFEGVRVDAGGELGVLGRADEAGRHLAGVIENMQLLADLLRSRRELEDAFDSISDLVAVSDRRGRIVHVNQAFASRVGSTRAQLVDRPLADHLGPDLKQHLTEHEADMRPGHASWTREIVDPVLNGTFIVTFTDLLNHERERVGSVIVARDVTPQTRLEQEREDLRSRLTQTEKLAALGQFVAGIAHELNNPLQGVLGHLELLRATGAFPKPLRGEMQTIYREADRAAKIVRNLLVFAGSRRLSPRPVSLNSVLQKVVVLRTPACRAAGIEIVRHYDDKLPRVPSDPLLLHQAFLNIVMNAEQAVASTGRGGRIEISTSLAPSGDKIVATIRDTGPGIPADVLSRIFEPFYTTKDVGKGTGLGLAIAYGIFQEHGGQIVAGNDPSGGALFTIELPAATLRGAAGR